MRWTTFLIHAAMTTALTIYNGHQAHPPVAGPPPAQIVVGGLRSDTFIPRISNLILRDLSGCADLAGWKPE
jgi:hypothetical protein